MFPPTLFQRGVTAVGPLEISDANKAMTAISEAGGGYALLKCARYVVYVPQTNKKSKPVLGFCLERETATPTYSYPNNRNQMVSSDLTLALGPECS